MNVTKKNIIIIILLSFIVFVKPCLADSVVSADGAVSNGKIDAVLENLVIIKTSDGLKKLIRDKNSGQTRDIIEVGFLKTHKIVGKIRYLDNQKIEIDTTSGFLSIEKYKVRNIIITQEASDF